jgi:hypothetical protein
LLYLNYATTEANYLQRILQASPGLPDIAKRIDGAGTAVFGKAEGAHSFGPCAQESGELLGRHRPLEVETVPGIAADLAQDLQLS